MFFGAIFIFKLFVEGGVQRVRVLPQVLEPKVNKTFFRQFKMMIDRDRFIG